MSAPTDPEGAIEVEAVGITMRFGEFTALDAVSARIRPGSFHALLGENGAGKSTLVKCLMGFYRATSGGVLVDGREAPPPMRSVWDLAWSISISRWCRR